MGTSTSSNLTAEVAEARWPSMFSFLPFTMPFAAPSTTNAVNALPAGTRASASERASTKYLQE